MADWKQVGDLGHLLQKDKCSLVLIGGELLRHIVLQWILVGPVSVLRWVRRRMFRPYLIELNWPRRWIKIS